MASKLSIATKKPKQFPITATFPPPPKFLVQDSPTNPRGGLAFFEYWKEIAGTKDEPKDRADLVTAKFYLHIPVVIYKLVDPKRTNTVFATVDGPLWFENPEDYETEVPKRFGAARWHVLLNENGVHGQLMESYFSAGTWDDYPLEIDLNTLVRSEPKNADYLQWLKKKGIKTPWDNPEEEDDMQAGDVLKVVVDGMRETNQLVREKTEELSEVKLAAVEDELQRTREEQVSRTDVRLSAQNEGIKLVADAAREMVSMAREDRKQDVDVIQVLKTAVELVRPPQTDSGLGIFIEAMKDQNTKMLQMQESNQEFMRSVIGMRKNPDGTWTQGESQNQAGGFEVEITRFQRMADILGFQKPGAATQHQTRDEPQPYREPEKSFLSSIGSAFAENPGAMVGMVNTGVILLANIVHTIWGKPGDAVSPQEALAKSAAQPPPPVQQPQPQPQPSQPVNLKDWRSWSSFAQQIGQAFKAHFHGSASGQNGYSFAEWILSLGTGGNETLDGRKAYTSIKENLGPEGFDALIQGTPALLEVVKDTPAQYHQFLQDFFGYDEMIEKQNAQPEGKVA
jgi:hypothetical protein